MVAKITTGKDIYGALSYNQEKVNEGLGSVLSTNIIREPEDGNFNIGEMAEEFLRWMPNQFRVEKPVIHISMNPHEDDILTDEQLSDIAAKYMERMGYGKQPYVVFKHTDIQREHIHIVSVQVNSEGRKVNDRNSKRRSVAITEDLECEYNLIPAKGQKKSEDWQLSPVNPALGHLKKQIAAVIKPASKMYHFQTMGEFRALLSFYNVGIEEVQGTRNKKPYRGLLYTVLDNQSNKIGIPLKSSLFGEDWGMNALDKLMLLSAEKIKKNNNRELTRKRVANALNGATTEQMFKEKLKQKNIDLFIRSNDTGRIVGVTFIDHNERCVLNGSRLGKEFSANALERRFSEILKKESYSTQNNLTNSENNKSIKHQKRQRI